MRTYDSRHRLKHIALGSLVIWVIVFARLFQLQIVSHSSYEDRAKAQHNRRVPLTGIRGTIYDRNGEILAQDIRTSSVCAYPPQIRNKEATARELSSALGISYRKLLRSLKKDAGYVSIARKISAEAEARLREAKLPGIDLIDDTRRIYPLGGAACHVVGLVNTDGKGTEGVEAQLNDVLEGTPGWFILSHDARGKDVVTSRSLSKQPRPGASVMLTIDSRYQTIAASSLKRAVAENGAAGGSILILNPSTGEILAMVNEPSFDPGDRRTWKKAAMRNRAVTDQFEPGSTFKLITLAAVLEEGMADTSSTFFAENGMMNFGKFRIRDTSKHGWLTLKQAFAYSSNIVAAKLGIELGPETFYKYCRAFSFGATTGVELPGEVSGTLRNPSVWSQRSLPTMAMGQEISVTCLQLAMAYAAAGNDGVLMRPSIVKKVEDKNGKPVREWAPRRVRRVLSSSTARTVRELLATAVDEGTGRNARVDWCRLGGKTGTAQKYSPKTRTYSRFVGSFAGLVPAENSRIICLVVLDEPAEEHLGALVAAPAFKEVIETVSKCARPPLAPDFARIPFVVENDAPLPVPDVRLLGEREAARALRSAGFRTEVRGIGSRVFRQYPPPGVFANAGATVELEMAENERSLEGDETIPDLRELPLREALRRLSSVAVIPDVKGSGIVVAQHPPAGSRIRPGQVCVLRCSPPADLYRWSAR
ncbi:MAG: PASTA domain-containing protein [Candidatus Eiseniibacteriota bacterium]|nr:MAG: PASTA domain-containing protein [Candidatus Eisenbacteria bacterium]